MSPPIHLLSSPSHSAIHRKGTNKAAMETCFLTSNSFTKTIEFVPSIQAGILTYPNRFSKQFKCRRAGTPFSVTCCHVDSDNSFINNNDDWRSFRAKLVAGEQASRSKDKEPSSSFVDLDSVVDHDHPLPITVSDKWAHTIHEPEKGCLLIATEKLDGVHIFERTVILLVSNGPMGPSGIILNRPSLMSIKEMRSTALDVAGTFSDRPLFFGGPLEEGMFLVSGDNEGVVGRSGVFEEVMKGLYYGTKESVGCAAEMVKRNVIGVGELRFFDGYCGWEKEQLKDEIRSGYWTVAACSPSVIELASVGSVRLWEEVLGLMGPRKVW